ncbi:hypothetical protein ATEIFO6365_0002098600 [Aspergillus terreus]|uniref:Uncharacterized protein n=1 Tax=Aspergillus terreus TaxID=33178 RepID=A0A5M3YVV3_ASPTE|nr:hypothetical protein ATETN484_0004080700 [Aspergillus terreus]GFF13875.1 hypothetical protein ATEIFO6365_0002098600 [Aspergillus terreus]
MTKPSPAPHILHLPDELLLQIAHDLSLATLNSLIKTCRRAFKSLTHQLYARALRDEPRRRSNGHPSLASKIGRIGSPNAVHHCMEHRPLGDEEGQVFWAECLREAAANGHADAVRRLLDAGVEPDRPSGGPIACRPIFTAAENNHLDIVEMLLAAGLQLGSPDDVRDCPLYAAMVRSPRPSMALVQMLLEKGRYPTAHITTLLYAAAGAGRADMAELMLDVGAEIDARDAEGRTPLCLAIEQGHYDTIRMLLRCGASVTNVDDSGATPLCLAVENKETNTAAVVKLLVEHGADPNERYQDGHTPLHVATNIDGGKDEIVLALLEYGADWRVTRGDWNLPPLLNAMQTCSEPCAGIQHLIDYGAASYLPHYTPGLLYWAASLGYDNIVRRYIEHVGDVEAGFVNDRQSPTRVIFRAVARGREALLKMILPFVTDVDWKSRMHGSAVTEAARIGSEASLRLVLERATRSGVEATDLRGRTALMFAAKSMSAETVSLILERCSNIHARDTSGRTALHYAVDGDNAGVVSLLLQGGLDPMAVDSAQRTPHIMGLCSANLAIIDIFYDRLPDIDVINSLSETPLIVACQGNRVQVAEELLKRGADIEVKHVPSKRTPLTIACEMGFEPLAKMLLDHGADPYIRYYGRPNIAIAASHGHTGIVKMLVEHGVPIDLTSNILQTPLIMAAKTGHAEVVDALHGADVDHADITGRSALSYAAEVKEGRTIQCLLDRGADPDLLDVQGRSPLSWAVLAGNIDGITILVDAGADIAKGDKQGHTPVGHAMRLGDEKAIKILYQKYY